MDTIIRVLFGITVLAALVGANLWVVGTLYRALTASELVVMPFRVIDPTGKTTNLEEGLTQLFLAQLQRVGRNVAIARVALREPLQLDLENLTYESLSRARTFRDEELRAELLESGSLELKVAGLELGGLVNWIREYLARGRTLQFTVYYGEPKAVIAGNIDALGGPTGQSVWIKTSANPTEIAADLAYRLHQIRLSDQEFPALRSLELPEFRRLVERLSEVAQLNASAPYQGSSLVDYVALYEKVRPLSAKLSQWDSLQLLTASLARRGGRSAEAIEYYKDVQRVYEDLGRSTKEIEDAIRKTRAEVRTTALARAERIVITVSDRPIVLRRDVTSLSSEELSRLQKAFAELYSIPDERGYAFLAGIYGLPLPIFSIHADVRFLFWNRAYLHFFEQHLRNRENQGFLPYWNWASMPRTIPTTYSEAAGVDNPLSKARIPFEKDMFTQRNPSLGDLPTNEEVNLVLALEGFRDFRARLEGLSNRVHVSVGGTMAQVTTAAYDPLFWAHRANVDRLFAMWQSKHGNESIPAEILDDELAPFGITIRDVLDTNAVGYEYTDNSASR